MSARFRNPKDCPQNESSLDTPFQGLLRNLPQVPRQQLRAQRPSKVHLPVDLMLGLVCKGEGGHGRIPKNTMSFIQGYMGVHVMHGGAWG